MKIFNWVQRRFHPGGGLKDGLAQNVKKAEAITNEADRQALLKQVALAGVLDGWKDGILTIGTLGLDPLKPSNQQTYYVLESEIEEEGEDYGNGALEEEEKLLQLVDNDGDDGNINVEDEEVNPLISTTFQHNFEHIGSNCGAENAVKPADVIMAVNDDGVTLAPSNTSSIFSTENDQRKKKGQRMTLAELFMADSDMKKKPDSFEVEIQTSSAKDHKPVAADPKNGLSFSKKFLPHARKESRPVKRLHQLMRKMLKRKIHPELDVKGSEMDSQNKPGTVELPTSNEKEAGESVSLLQAPPGAAAAAAAAAAVI